MEREELFLAGLLHDLGKVPFGDEYIEVLGVAKREQRPLITVEREILGIDHQEVGLMIAEKWKLNTVITKCITSHHNIDSLEGEIGVQVAMIALGNCYTNILEHGYAGDPFPEEEEIHRLLRFVDLSPGDFGSIGGYVDEEIHKAELFLQI